ncbi:metallo-beta-lactamase domain-containing protein 1-like [Dendronephthya gigantea]|uniref:metallo-beta-lactamase domain-containing protein 1-like n=1 Tax=Dendronephthya gigantea TaxID=151771 RepID=UPI00106D152C|nr:metallo-beta-lactamase domain-containing protein 1-like [Dendronephthya gigantea]
MEGYSYEGEDGLFRANGTCTLITGPKNIIVDTGSPSDREKIINSLKEHGLATSDIDYVICTHGHIDHVGNLNLFPGAKFIVGYDIMDGDSYAEHDFKGGSIYRINDNIEVIPTPGHTHSDVSVLVRNVEIYGTVVICGDLFEKEHDENDWQSLSECIEEQKKNREKILKLANYVIPGHGAMFATK